MKLPLGKRHNWKLLSTKMAFLRTDGESVMDILHNNSTDDSIIKNNFTTSFTTTTTNTTAMVTESSIPFFDLCVHLGLRLPNESFVPPSLPETDQNATCPVGTQENLDRNSADIFTEKMCTFPSPGIPDWEIALKVISYSIAILLAFIGNALVIYVIVSSKRMRSRTNVFILNLAITDVCSPFVCMIPHLGNGITAHYRDLFTFAIQPLADSIYVDFKLDQIQPFFLPVLKVTSGVFFLTWIAIDRFFAIVFPLKMGISKGLLALILICTWISALAVALPLLFYTERQEIIWFNQHEVWCSENWPSYYYLTEPDQDCLTETPTKTIFYTIYIVLLYFVPIIVMATVYMCIVHVLWTRPAQQGAAVEASRQKTRKKVVRMLLILFLAFVVCYSPMQALILYDVYRSNDVQFPEWYSPSMYAATYLAYSNSAINPILYAGLNSNFRRGFTSACRMQTLMKRFRSRAIHPAGNQTNSSQQPHSSDLPSASHYNKPVDKDSFKMPKKY